MKHLRQFNPRHWTYLLAHVLLFVLGVLLLQLGKSWAGAVGASLVAAAVAGWVLFVWLLMNDGLSRQVAVVTDLGLSAAFPSRSTTIKPHYDERLDDAKRSIEVMGFGLRQMVEDYGELFDEWCNRAVVRILLLDPEASANHATFADQRDLEESNPSGRIAGEVRDFLARTEGIRSSRPDRFQVRLYTCLPSINIFRVDDEVFWGPYFVRTASRNTPTFLVNKRGALFEPIVGHFEAIWTSDDLSRPPG